MAVADVKCCAQSTRTHFVAGLPAAGPDPGLPGLNNVVLGGACVGFQKGFAFPALSAVV